MYSVLSASEEIASPDLACRITNHLFVQLLCAFMYIADTILRECHNLCTLDFAIIFKK